MRAYGDGVIGLTAGAFGVLVFSPFAEGDLFELASVHLYSFGSPQVALFSFGMFSSSPPRSSVGDFVAAARLFHSPGQVAVAEGFSEVPFYHRVTSGLRRFGVCVENTAPLATCTAFVYLKVRPKEGRERVGFSRIY